ncbi:hypothetical protein [Salinigranum halophilum]|uniref:hypothetical protein n=1 Tax=Salinigranum halophilum TaxID=2565931 RepID=UPI0010A7B40E|nr:hypothetical protein [Salinigranum halophilum]
MPTRFRTPSADSFSLAVALLAGGIAAVALPLVDRTAVDGGAAVLVALLTWVLLEQVPDAVDRAVEARAHLVVGGVVMLPLVGSLVGDALGRTVLPERLTLPLLALSFVGLVVTETGRSRRCRLLRARETVRLHLVVTESARRRAVLAFASALSGVVVVRLLAGDAIGAPTLVGVLVGTGIGLALVDSRALDVYVLDRGLVVVPQRRLGASVVPWRRVRRVSTVEGALRIDRGLPWPTRYEYEFAAADDSSEVVDTLRRCRRSA